MSLNDELKEAILWRIRVRDGDDDDWSGFTHWLEGDPARSAAYDRVAMIDQDFDASREQLVVALSGETEVVPAPIEQSRRRFGRAMIAAAAVVAISSVAVWRPWDPARDLYRVTTADGERRSVTLEAGTRIDLNGGTTVLLDRENPRFVELTRGEAAFVVRHDATRPFNVVSDGTLVRDTGTRFNVLRDGQRFEVEVAEGSVLYNPDQEKIALVAGQALRSTGSGKIVVSARAVGQMSGWQRGQLSYVDASLASVVSDMSRSLGVRIVVESGLSQQRFSGSVRVDNRAQMAVEGLAATLGLAARRTASGWMLEQGQRAVR